MVAFIIEIVIVRMLKLFRLRRLTKPHRGVSILRCCGALRERMRNDSDETSAVFCA